MLDDETMLCDIQIFDKALLYLVVLGTVVQAWYTGEDLEWLGPNPRWLGGKIVKVLEDGECRIRCV